MTWLGAYTRALVIFLYFVVATVWLPNRLLQIGSVADASAGIRDSIILLVWGGGLAGGIWLLRLGQRRGLI